MQYSSFILVQIGANLAIAAQTGKFMGIRNGIDLDIWDPENDALLPMPYSASNIVEVRRRQQTFFPPCSPSHGQDFSACHMTCEIEGAQHSKQVGENTQ